jgi:hypothetical protein
MKSAWDAPGIADENLVEPVSERASAWFEGGLGVDYFF